MKCDAEGISKPLIEPGCQDLQWFVKSVFDECIEMKGRWGDRWEGSWRDRRCEPGREVCAGQGEHRVARGSQACALHCGDGPGGLMRCTAGRNKIPSAFLP